MGWRERGLAMARSSWTLGLIAAVLSWNVVFTPPFPGLDPSWAAGLYMAAHRGLHFGSQVLFTYGPLGFLAQPWMWYSDLSALAFLYQGLLHVLVCVSLVWALRRTLHPLPALVGASLLLVSGDGLDTAVVLTAVWSLALLTREPPRYVRPIVTFGVPVLGAAETLVYVRSGVLVLAMGTIALTAGGRPRRDLPAFAAAGAVGFLALWFASGQALANLGEYVGRSGQIVSGYSEAMGLQAVGTGYRWWSLVAGMVLVSGAGASAAPQRRTRIGSAVLMVAIAYVLFKEANVRAEIGHTVTFFATGAGIAAALCFGRRWRLAAATIVLAVAVNLHIASVARESPTLDPTSYVSRAYDQVRLLFDPAQRNLETYFFFGVRMAQTYGLPAGMQHELKGVTVGIEPEEVAVAWVYGLRWIPGPVIQGYSAYTSELDRVEADALSSAGAPARILRGLAPGGTTTYPLTSIDTRLTAWDPPLQHLAMLCHYAPLSTTARWEVLARVPDRCGPARRLASLSSGFGATITLPSAPAGTVVFAQIHGAGVSGLERIRTLLFRARLRYAVINGAQAYRLVPGTAADGLILDAAPGVDYPRPFSLAPGARTLRLLGSSGRLRIDIYEMPVGQLIG